MAIEELGELPAAGPLLRRAAAGGLVFRKPRPRPLPLETELLVRDVAVDLDHLARYDRVCGFRLGDELPPTYPHVLAFPLALELMTRSTFPFPLPGLVHTDNETRQDRPLRAGERFDIRVKAVNLRDHERGRAVDLVTVVATGGVDVWRERSTYLRKERKGTRTASPATTPPDPQGTWRVGTEVGKDYARASGDRNPIHTSTLFARMFGFRRPDRARHVEPGPVSGRAGGPDSGRVHGGRHVPPADPAAGHRRLLVHDGRCGPALRPPRRRFRQDPRSQRDRPRLAAPGLAAQQGRGAHPDRVHQAGRGDVGVLAGVGDHPVGQGLGRADQRVGHGGHVVRRAPCRPADALTRARLLVTISTIRARSWPITSANGSCAARLPVEHRPAVAVGVDEAEERPQPAPELLVGRQVRRATSAAIASISRTPSRCRQATKSSSLVPR